ncbi:MULTISPECIES: methyltransferase domain-containing protein [unclassified Streptomyces]|uniref:methyltransferase domain-containing protein n=1 Tax=unclassified Streptomyces TaxID=2593676 RepID=UPI00278BBF21|nr:MULTISPECIES: methyltransferase domain-containing protein [unclassified Streptomyces]
MTDLTDYERSIARSRAALQHPDRPRTFELAGRTWDLLDGVFAPPFSAATSAAMELLGLASQEPKPWYGSFLDVGCGTGVIGLSAAAAGCDRVTALDVNPQAVENAALNARRHGLADRARAVHSDLFDALDAEDRYDTVYWHSNFVLAPARYYYDSEHERAYVDPGYRAHRRFLSEAPGRTTAGGRVLLHVSNRADLSTLSALAEECGRELHETAAVTVREGTDDVRHMLYEVTARA